MKKIAVVTATRAEYGLLSPVIRELRKREDERLRVELIVTGTHLSEEYGMTVNEIRERIDHRVIIPVASRMALDISLNQAETLVSFTRLFLKERYEAVLLLGDRYETLAIAIAAGNSRLPIFHMCGGDTTEGAMDEWIRHSITKMSYLHFVTNDVSRKRVIQLGEHPSRVFDYGSTSIDNILALPEVSKAEALKSVGLDTCSYALCTYHPVTMDEGAVDEQIQSFLDAIRAFPQMQFLVTKSNADQGGARINSLLEEAEGHMENLHVYTSLGAKKYLSLMKYCEFVLGNSSSGIIEAPALHVPTVDIGDRQKGRSCSRSVIHCGDDSRDIIDAISMALSDGHKQLCRDISSPYGDGHTAKKIALKVMDTVWEGRIDLKKEFYDL